MYLNICRAVVVVPEKSFTDSKMCTVCTERLLLFYSVDVHNSPQYPTACTPKYLDVRRSLDFTCCGTLQQIPLFTVSIRRSLQTRDSGAVFFMYYADNSVVSCSAVPSLSVCHVVDSPPPPYPLYLPPDGDDDKVDAFPLVRRAIDSHGGLSLGRLFSRSVHPIAWRDFSCPFYSGFDMARSRKWNRKSKEAAVCRRFPLFLSHHEQSSCHTSSSRTQE